MGILYWFENSTTLGIIECSGGLTQAAMAETRATVQTEIPSPWLISSLANFNTIYPHESARNHIFLPLSA
jgi:hypothetical protein